MINFNNTNPAESFEEDCRITLDPHDPMAIARLIIHKKFSSDGTRTLHHHAGTFRQWENNCYPIADDKAIRAIVYRMLEDAVRITGGGFAPFKPKAANVNNVMDALCAVANLNNKINAPAWLERGEHPNPKNILSLRNGLLNLSDRSLIEPTPLFWTHNALGYDYSSEETDCKQWHLFLQSIWGSDTESIETLQEIFGYSLTGDTSQQKMVLLIGPPRSGKGTIGSILAELLGHNNICSPTLNSLTGNFGMAPMIDKLVAIVADARLGHRADQHQIAEKLLSVSGEDWQTIDIKYKTPWQGRLPTRIFIMSNELPRIADASGALNSRFIVLKMTESFLGREDRGLTKRLLGELPAILNWALDGRERLMNRGHFLQPASSENTMQELSDLSSPIGAFLRDSCEIGPLFEEKVDRMFEAWQSWCAQQGRDHCGIKQTFSRDLNAAVPTLKTKQQRGGNSTRARYFKGIKLI